MNRRKTYIHSNSLSLAPSRKHHDLNMINKWLKTGMIKRATVRFLIMKLQIYILKRAKMGHQVALALLQGFPSYRHTRFVDENQAY